MTLCPCQISPTSNAISTAIAYQKCCQPLHHAVHKASGVQAKSAEALMRSRYSAFVLMNADYIMHTTLPTQQAFLDIEAITSWAHKTDWAGLEIINHAPKLGKRHAQVEFKAYYHTTAGVMVHHELSSFVKLMVDDDHDRWYFLDPTLKMHISQKQPCFCGSGEKFKRCCGHYI